MVSRIAHPYRDLDVIDARAPRFNQTVIGTLALVAFLTGWWPLLGLLALQLALGLTLGRRWCLPCLAYFELVQPRLGEGPLEDSRPPRFANVLGAIVLGSATVAHLAGLHTIGWVLGLLVAGLALLAVASGLCVGCEMYRISARMRGIGSRHLGHVDLADVNATANGHSMVIEFTHPLCSDCRTLEQALREEGREVITVDVSRRPDLARKYGVGVVPTAVEVTGTGRVLARLA
ncbi:MAG: DUF4395 family protein [Gaiellales bacterium]